MKEFWRQNKTSLSPENKNIEVWVCLVCPAVSLQIFPVVGEQFISVSHEEKYILHAFP